MPLRELLSAKLSRGKVECRLSFHAAAARAERERVVLGEPHPREHAAADGVDPREDGVAPLVVDGARGVATQARGFRKLAIEPAVDHVGCCDRGEGDFTLAADAPHLIAGAQGAFTLGTAVALVMSVEH